MPVTAWEIIEERYSLSFSISSICLAFDNDIFLHSLSKYSTIKSCSWTGGSQEYMSFNIPWVILKTLIPLTCVWICLRWAFESNMYAKNLGFCFDFKRAITVWYPAKTWELLFKYEKLPDEFVNKEGFIGSKYFYVMQAFYDHIKHIPNLQQTLDSLSSKKLNNYDKISNT